MPVVAHASAKLKLSEHGGIYEIEWRWAKSKLSNELECGGIYGMTYEKYIYIAGDAVSPVWGSLRLAPIKQNVVECLPSKKRSYCDVVPIPVFCAGAAGLLGSLPAPSLLTSVAISLPLGSSQGAPISVALS